MWKRWVILLVRFVINDELVVTSLIIREVAYVVNCAVR